jgi:hypothetical protein
MIVIIATIILFLICMSSGSLNVFSGILTPFLIYLVVNSESLYLSIPGLFFSLLGLFMFKVLGWDDNPKKPLFWKIIQHLPSIGACVLVIIFYIIPTYSTGKQGIISFIYTSIMFLVFSFIITRSVITNPIYRLINMLYTKEEFLVRRKILAPKLESGYRSATYYIHIRETEDGIFHINSILSIYLNYFVKGKTVEFTLKRGCLGLLYCSNFPKVVS